MTIYLLAVVAGLAGLARLITGRSASRESPWGDIALADIAMVSAVLLGFGAGGLAGTAAGAPGLVTVAAGIGVAAGGLSAARAWMVPYLARQQAFSFSGHDSVIGRLAMVTAPIEVGGRGEVVLEGVDGGRESRPAVSGGSRPLPVGTVVYVGARSGRELRVIAVPRVPGPSCVQPDGN
ncbi:NfeD family protein [Nocardia sp. NBC_00511]|uniref:NfeD family protein n=1 Tax=Nocardia sp. NBC_00511 TaxID=2903591 RepID=UPI0030E3CFEC